jgi:hypothetical protein
LTPRSLSKNFEDTPHVERGSVPKTTYSMQMSARRKRSENPEVIVPCPSLVCSGTMHKPFSCLFRPAFLNSRSWRYSGLQSYRATTNVAARNSAPNNFVSQVSERHIRIRTSTHACRSSSERFSSLALSINTAYLSIHFHSSILFLCCIPK